MENKNVDINNLKCIIITRDGKYDSMLSYNQYLRNFVVERWIGERRTKKKHTIFGYWHTKTIVTNPTYKLRSVRVFDFPETIEEAIQRDYDYNNS